MCHAFEFFRNGTIAAVLAGALCGLIGVYIVLRGMSYIVKTEWIDTLFALMLTAALIASMQIMGVTLIAAAPVIPAISARLLTDSFNRVIAYSTLRC